LAVLSITRRPGQKPRTSRVKSRAIVTGVPRVSFAGLGAGRACRRREKKPSRCQRAPTTAPWRLGLLQMRGRGLLRDCAVADCRDRRFCLVARPFSSVFRSVFGGPVPRKQSTTAAWAPGPNRKPGFSDQPPKQNVPARWARRCKSNSPSILSSTRAPAPIDTIAN